MTSPGNLNLDTGLANNFQRPHHWDTTVLYDLINAIFIFRSTQLREE
jgi:hypothetical protein